MVLVGQIIGAVLYGYALLWVWDMPLGPLIVLAQYPLLFWLNSLIAEGEQ
jgi:hypothetical protein